MDDFFAAARPEYVFLVAGESGGIAENERRPADLMLDNLLVAANVIGAAWRRGVAKLLYVSSSCAYPKDAPQPLAVASLLTGPLEPTSEAYALAKLAGWKLCDAFRRQYGARFITAFPANPFGPGDDFSAGGHVIPALMRRVHRAKEDAEPAVTIWGSGAPRREFIYLPDLADACVFLMRHYDRAAPINVGAGSEHSIAEVARAVAQVVGYRGRLVFDTSRPDGAARKTLDSTSLLALGWQPPTGFRAALEEIYAWFLAHGAKEEQHARAAV
ncbi:MAG: GDP-L-fucose synthase [Gemmataceae bacterium]